MPAAELASEGVVLPSLANAPNNLTQGTGRMTQFPSSMRAYAKSDGSPWNAEETLRFPDLARSLTAIAEGGQDAFYRGWIADSIAADMSRNNGLITKADLARYEAVVREPITTTYKGYDLAMMGPPSGGGVIIAQALNTLENFDLKGMGQTSPQAVHLVIESIRRAFLDRARHLGDIDFSPAMPIARLTSKEYGRQLAGEINRNLASNSAELGSDILSVAMVPERDETTHYSVIDGDGMAVSVTYTLEGGYGSAVVASGTGFILNNEMGDFNRIPGLTDTGSSVGTLPNQIAPEKRMLSSMVPTIVLRDGRVVLITGSPGGRSIPSTVLGVVLGVVEFDRNGREHQPPVDARPGERGDRGDTRDPAVDDRRADRHGACGEHRWWRAGEHHLGGRRVGDCLRRAGLSEFVGERGETVGLRDRGVRGSGHRQTVARAYPSWTLFSRRSRATGTGLVHDTAAAAYHRLRPP